jgi:hypothetical protein
MKRGTEAADLIKQANQFNQPAKPGNEHILIKGVSAASALRNPMRQSAWMWDRLKRPARRTRSTIRSLSSRLLQI